MRLLDNRQTLHRRLDILEQTNQHLLNALHQAQHLSGLGLAWSITAHELNNLLTLMTNYAQHALHYPDDKELSTKALEKTVFIGQRAGEILEKVMDLAAGKPMKTDRVEVSALLEDVLLCIGRDFEKDGITLIRDCPPGVWIQGDRVMLGQVFLNLMLNARRAMLPKGGTLYFAARPTANGTRIELTDTGRGMSAATLSRIFEPFYGDDQSQPDYDGNGLGLYFCKHIIDVHQGSIQVQSEPHRGTTFRILLPGS